jgi:hypothetical protein
VRTGNEQALLSISRRKIQGDMIGSSVFDDSFFCWYLCATDILGQIASRRHIVPTDQSVIRAINFAPEHIIWRFRKHNTMFRNAISPATRLSAPCPVETQIVSCIPSFLSILFVFDCLMRLSVANILLKSLLISEMKKWAECQERMEPSRKELNAG